MEHLPVILGASLIWLAAVVSPGPNFLVVSRLALARSRHAALGATVGIAVGSLIYAALTMFGLSVLLQSFAWLGEALRVLGGAYLVWLGIEAWRSREAPSGAEDGVIAPAARRSVRGFDIGFLTEVTNPKAIAFFLGLFAAALPVATPLWAKLAVLSIGGTMEMAWYTIVAVVLASGPMRREYQRLRRRIDCILGTLLIAVGVKVALDAR
jgi:threonine efflux protein